MNPREHVLGFCLGTEDRPGVALLDLPPLANARCRVLRNASIASAALQACQSHREAGDPPTTSRTVRRL